MGVPHRTEAADLEVAHHSRAEVDRRLIDPAAVYELELNATARLHALRKLSGRRAVERPGSDGHWACEFPHRLIERDGAGLGGTAMDFATYAPARQACRAWTGPRGIRRRSSPRCVG